MTDIQDLIDNIQSINDRKKLNMIHRAWRIQNKKQERILIKVLSISTTVLFWAFSPIYLGLFLMVLVPYLQESSYGPFELYGFLGGFIIGLAVLIYSIMILVKLIIVIQDWMTIKQLNVKFNK